MVVRSIHMGSSSICCLDWVLIPSGWLVEVNKPHANYLFDAYRSVDNHSSLVHISDDTVDAKNQISLTRIE